MSADRVVIRCDALGCRETHPILHENVGEPGYELGRWLGWVYLNLNNENLVDRELRFCSAHCCLWWLEREIVRPQLTELDKALRSRDELAVRRTLAKAASGEKVRPPQRGGWTR